MSKQIFLLYLFMMSCTLSYCAIEFTSGGWNVLVDNAKIVTVSPRDGFFEDETEISIPHYVYNGDIQYAVNRFNLGYRPNITTVNIPSSIDHISTEPNQGVSLCPNLKEIVVEEANQNLCSLDGVVYNKDKTKLICYPRGKEDKDFQVPQSIKTINSYAFDCCKYLENLSLSDSTITVGSLAFQGCSLKSLKIPNPVCTIGSGPFNGASIDKLYLNTMNLSTTGWYTGRLQNCTINEIIIGPDVRNIMTNLCRDLTSLTNVVIPTTITSMDYWAFDGCTGLTSLQIPSTEIYIPTNAFGGCSGILQIEINQKEAGGEGWIKNLKNLQEVVLQDSVQTIVGSAFRYLDKLQTINFGRNITDIGDCAFEGCSSIEELRLPSSVTKMNRYAFAHCTSLSYVEIGENMQYISDNAFGGCNGLQNVFIAATTPPTLENNAFPPQSVTATCTLHVPRGCKTAFENSDWSKYFMSIVEEDELTTINKGNIQENATLNKVYDMQGHSISNPQKGSIYIINGKKRRY